MQMSQKQSNHECTCKGNEKGLLAMDEEPVQRWSGPKGGGLPLPNCPQEGEAESESGQGKVQDS